MKRRASFRERLGDWLCALFGRCCLRISDNGQKRLHNGDQGLDFLVATALNQHSQLAQLWGVLLKLRIENLSGINAQSSDQRIKGCKVWISCIVFNLQNGLAVDMDGVRYLGLGFTQTLTSLLDAVS